jgi:hypothetical protein
MIILKCYKSDKCISLYRAYRDRILESFMEKTIDCEDIINCEKCPPPNKDVAINAIIEGRKKYLMRDDMANKIVNLYIEKNNGDIDKAFNDAAFERYEVLEYLYEKGVTKDTIKHSIEWLSVGPRKRSADLVRLLIKYEKEMMTEKANTVVHYACLEGHIEILLEMLRFNKDIDMLRAANECVMGDQMECLGLLTSYGFKIQNNFKELFKTAILFDKENFVLQLLRICNCKLTQDDIISIAENCFYDTLHPLLEKYIEDGGERFKITKDLSDKIMSVCSGIFKIKLFKESGFEIDNYETIINSTPPKDQKTRYIELRGWPK